MSRQQEGRLIVAFVTCLVVLFGKTHIVYNKLPRFGHHMVGKMRQTDHQPHNIDIYAIDAEDATIF